MLLFVRMTSAARHNPIPLSIGVLLRRIARTERLLILDLVPVRRVEACTGALVIR